MVDVTPKRMIVRLPHYTDHNDSSQSAVPECRMDGDLGLVSVLIVDDDPAIARLLRLILALEDIEVAHADSGERAVSLLSEAKVEPDCILMDLSMPGMDGKETFKEIRRSGVASPVVFCSAYGAAQANVEVGAQGAIEKPFDPVEVLAIVKALAIQDA
jgi:DNA-binding response OmpR family regulator